MNRGQLKRIRKEIERLCHCEKEWEALRLISREGGVDELSAEWTDLWRGRVRYALRAAGPMEEFLTQLEGFPNAPDTPDLRLLKALDEHLAGRDVKAFIGGLTGLSAPAETLRRELLRLGDLSKGTDPKLAALLDSFALTPEAVAPKDYRRVGELLSPFSAVSADACGLFEELLTRYHKLNSVQAVEKQADGYFLDELCAIDLQLTGAISYFPQALSELLAAPLLAQVAALLGRVAESSPEQAAALALCAPEAMELLAGRAWPPLREKLRLEAGEELSADDLAGLRKSAREAGFEERFRLVNKLADLMRAEDDLDPELYQILVIVYQGIFKDLTQKRASLPEREQRRLAVVFGPVFSRHLPLLWGLDGDLPFILDDAAAAGCLDPTSALLHTFFAVKGRDRGMTAKARAMLKLLPPIKGNEVECLFAQYQIFLAEDLKSVKSMLVICQESGQELTRLVASSVWTTLLMLLFQTTLTSAAKGNPFFGLLMGPELSDLNRACKKMLKGVGCFADDPEFGNVLSLAQAFPDGQITGERYALMLQRQLDSGVSPEQVIQFFSSFLCSTGEAAKHAEMEIGMNLPFGDILGTDELLQEVLLCGLDALCDDPVTVAGFDAANLSAIAEIVKKYCLGNNLNHYLLLIGSVARQRMKSGDKGMEQLQVKLTDYLALQKKPVKKGKRR